MNTTSEAGEANETSEDLCSALKDVIASDREISVRKFYSTKVLRCEFPPGKYNFHIQLTNRRTQEIVFSDSVNLYCQPRKYRVCFVSLEHNKYKCMKRFKTEDDMYAWIDNLSFFISVFPTNPSLLYGLFRIPENRSIVFGEKYLIEITILYMK